MARVIPQVGMPARVLHLGSAEETVVEAVLDDGRTLVAGGARRFTLRRLTGRYVLEGEPYFGTRLALAPGPGTMAPAGQ
jgi:hypothetical protein